MFKRIIDTMHRRDSGFLVRRYISFSGHIVAMAIMIMLVCNGDLTEGYFGIYVSFIAAHASMEKFIAHKPDRRSTGKYTGPSNIDYGEDEYCDSDDETGYYDRPGYKYPPPRQDHRPPGRPSNNGRNRNDGPRIPTPPRSSFETRDGAAKPEDDQ